MNILEEHTASVISVETSGVNLHHFCLSQNTNYIVYTYHRKETSYEIYKKLTVLELLLLLICFNFL